MNTSDFLAFNRRFPPKWKEDEYTSESQIRLRLRHLLSSPAIQKTVREDYRAKKIRKAISSKIAARKDAASTLTAAVGANDLFLVRMIATEHTDLVLDRLKGKREPAPSNLPELLKRAKIARYYVPIAERLLKDAYPRKRKSLIARMAADGVSFFVMGLNWNFMLDGWERSND